MTELLLPRLGSPTTREPAQNNAFKQKASSRLAPRTKRCGPIPHFRLDPDRDLAGSCENSIPHEWIGPKMSGVLLCSTEMATRPKKFKVRNGTQGVRPLEPRRKRGHKWTALQDQSSRLELSVTESS